MHYISYCSMIQLLSSLTNRTLAAPPTAALRFQALLVGHWAGGVGEEREATHHHYRGQLHLHRHLFERH